MPTAIIAEMECFEMGGKDLEALFAMLKSLTDGQDELRKDLREIRTEMGEMRRDINGNAIQLSVMEVNLDNTNSKVSDIVPALKEKCKKHEDEIRATTKFIEAHDTKEKTLFGIRADVIAWISLVGLFLAMGANYIKITENRKAGAS